MTTSLSGLSTEARERLLDKARRLGLKKRSNEARVIDTADRGQPLPLSFAQQRLWFLCQMGGVSEAYHIPQGLRLSGALDKAALKKALDRIVHRHEALRTTFELHEGQPVQRIAHADVGFALREHDLCGQDEAELEGLTQQEAQAPFDLAQGPLVRGRLIVLGDAQHVLLVTMHHIVSDGWSIGVLVKELSALYGAYSQGQEDPLPPLTIQYADYAAWQRRWVSGEVLQAQSTYWKETLTGAPAMLELPTDRPRPVAQSYAGAELELQLDAALTAQLKALSQRHGMTLFMTLLAGWAVVLGRLSSQQDVVIGTPVANRTHAEVQGLIGFFVNTQAIRLDLSGDPSVSQLLERTKARALGAQQHQDLPFEQVVELIKPARSLAYSPIFQVMFVWQGNEQGELALPGLALQEVEVPHDMVKFDLSLGLGPAGDGIAGSIRYSTALFDKATIGRLGDYLQRVLREMAADEEQAANRLAMLPQAERHRVLVAWNDTTAAYPADKCIHELFEAQVQADPEAAAVVNEDGVLSYGELNAQANRLAHHLRKLGIGPDDRVAICVERSPEMVVGLLGILKAGAGYVPLDPAYPAERLAYMLKDSAPMAVLTQAAVRERLETVFSELAEGVPVLALDGRETPWQEERSENLPAREIGLRPDHLAYLIYTSGSTGQPKGVMVEHHGLVNLAVDLQRHYGLSRSDRFSQFASLNFDASIEEIFIALPNGASVVLRTDAWLAGARAFYERCEFHGVTVINLPTLFWQQLLSEEDVDIPAKLRVVVISGDAVGEQAIADWFRRPGHRPALFNAYGPTETTVTSTLHAIRDAASNWKTIGRPVANTRIYILDAQGQPVPVGVAGELCIGGVGVARGYLDRPELTQQKFVADPFAREPGARMYRTGDLVRYMADGNIEFLGRNDFQVKIRGFRVELGEIETRLSQHEGVREAVVLARQDSPGDKRLVAYYTQAEGREEVSADMLRAHVLQALPEYMVPVAYVRLDALPQTPNGKLDRKALPAPEGEAYVRRSYMAPRTQTEEALAAIWAQVLKLDWVGVHDNFFDLGGNSIAGMLLMHRVQKQLGQIIHIPVLFDAPTIAQFAPYLASRASENRKIGIEDVDAIRRTIPVLQRRAQPVQRDNAPAAFILSAPRAGSTLLRVMLAGHPKLFVPPELELLPFNTLGERKAAFDGRNKHWLEGTIRAIMSAKRCVLEEATAIMAAHENADITTQQFYALLQEWARGRLLVDKSTEYALDVEALRRAEQSFEDARYIHLLRHPYGMITSFEEAKIEQVFFRFPHQFSPRVLAELIWVVSQQNIREFFQEVPAHRRCEVKYEDLVANPRPVLEQICQTLDIDYHDALLRPYENQQERMTDGIRPESRMLGDFKFLSYDGIDSQVADRWKDRVGQDFLGDITWELAESFGYARPRSDPERPETSITPQPRDGALPLSFAQQRLWFLCQMQGVSEAYHIPLGLRLLGALDRVALVKSLDRVVHRHEALRTSFELVDGEAVQRIARADIGFALREHDLRGHAEAEAELERLSQQEAQAPFDLQHGPLVRGRLIVLGEAQHVLLVTMHHIVSDGWSTGVLVKELSALYGAYRQGLEDPLPALAIQYADYAAWQRRWVSGDVLQTQSAYWQKNLAGAPALLELPTDRPRPAQQSHAGARQELRFDAALTAQLKALSRRHGTTLFMTLLAGWSVVLGRLAHQQDVVIGTPVANRTRAEVEGLIGFFVNTQAIRMDLSGNPTVSQLLERARERALGAQQNQDLPFEQVVELARPARSLSYSPIFQVMFVWQGNEQGELTLPGLELQDAGAGGTVAKFDLTLELQAQGDGIAGSLEYATALFDAATVERMGGYLLRVLQGMAADATQPVQRLEMLDPAQRHQLLVAWNDTTAEYPADRCIHELFEEQVLADPEAVAVVYEDSELSYGQLNAQANRLARHLRKLGVKPDDRVALCVARSPAMVVGLLGILKAGAAYVPLDPAYPRERLAYMLEDCAPVAVLTQAKLVQELQLPDQAVPVLALDAPALPWQGESDQNLPPREIGLRPEHLAYVIYTSGSTGQPKGVMVEHRSTCNQIASLQKHYGMTVGDRALQFVSFSFDVAFDDIFGCLAFGAAIVLRTDAWLSSTAEFVALCAKNRITSLVMPASFWERLADHGRELATVRQVTIGGEVASSRAVKAWIGNQPGPKLFHAYGPTEATVCASLFVCDADSPDRLPIGRPIANTRIYILDAQGQPVPAGVAGELHIGGVGVARGYLNRPALTAQRFVADPFAGDTEARMYKTGDLARYMPDGNIEFLGRDDDQVKVRGYRIELGEIETRLSLHEGVREAVVVAREDSPGDKRLVAYYTQAEGQEDLPAEALRAHVLQALPEYMVPAAYVRLQAWPQTPSGKLDRKGLPTPEEGAYAKRSYEAPVGEMEKTLADIWADVLQVERVGRQDNFFELGGHSLLAIRALERGRKIYPGLSLQLLIGKGSLRLLAEALASEDREDLASRTIFSIRKPDDRLQGEGPAPLFLVHDLVASDHYFSFLAQHIAQEIPIYGLPAVPPQQPQLDSMQEIARRLTGIIRSQQPSGPYRVAGWSFGGVVAYEIAQQLIRERQRVEFIGLIDAYCPNWIHESGYHSPVSRNAMLIEACAVHLEENLDAGGAASEKRKRLNALGETGEAIPFDRLLAECREARLLPDYLEAETDVEPIIRRLLAHHSAIRNHLAAPIANDVFLFRAQGTSKLETGSVEEMSRHCLGWDRVLSPRQIRIVSVPGTHKTMMSAPHIGSLGAAITQALQGA